MIEHIADIFTIIGLSLKEIIKWMLRRDNKRNLRQKIHQWRQRRQERKKIKELRAEAKTIDIPPLAMWKTFLEIMRQKIDLSVLSKAVEAGNKIITLAQEKNTNVDTIMKVFLRVMRKEIDIETVRRIIDSNLSYVQINIDNAAHDMQRWITGGHFKFGPGHCCSLHFDIVSFSTSNSLLRQELIVELTEEYKGRGVSRIFYLRRIGFGDSALIQTVGENLKLDVIPIIETEKWEKWVEPGTKVLIIDELIMNDDFLSKVIDYFSNLGAEIDGLAIIFDVKGSLKPSNIKEEKIKSLLTLDLGVSELKSPWCDYCRIGCPVEVYYQG